MADETPKAVPGGEVAVAGRGDITQQFVSPLQLTPTDKILTLKLGGDYEKYQEILRDDQVASAFQQRRLAVTCRPLEVTPASEDAADVEAADFIREQLAALPFDEITEKMLFGVFYGYAVAEVMWKIEGGRVGIDAIRVRQQRRFVFDKQHQLRLKMGFADPELMPDRKFWVFRAGGDHDDDPYGRGIAHDLYWPVYFKRNGLKFWLIYAEKFGVPTAVAKVPASRATDREYMAKALAVVSALQTDAGIAIPDDMVIDLLEAMRSSAGDYDRLYDRMDKAISKIVLSQTMTTDQGSSRSQAEVHERVADAVIESDSKLLHQSFNASVVRWLTAWNFPAARPPLVSRRLDDEPDLLPLAQRDQIIDGMGFAFTEQYVRDTYGVDVQRKKAPAMIPGEVPTPLEFAEPPVARRQNRLDQAQLVEVADQMANEIGARIRQRVAGLLTMLEETGNLAAFRERLADVLAEDPDPEIVELVARAGFTARMLGRLRAE